MLIVNHWNFVQDFMYCKLLLEEGHKSRVFDSFRDATSKRRRRLHVLEAFFKLGHRNCVPGMEY